MIGDKASPDDVMSLLMEIRGLLLVMLREGVSMDEIIAADAFRNTILSRADGAKANSPYWHGWAIIDAFRAGAAWERKRREEAKHTEKAG